MYPFREVPRANCTVEPNFARSEAGHPVVANLYVKQAPERRTANRNNRLSGSGFAVWQGRSKMSTRHAPADGRMTAIQQPKSISPRSAVDDSSPIVRRG